MFHVKHIVPRHGGRQAPGFCPTSGDNLSPETGAAESSVSAPSSSSATQLRRICDYEGSGYETDFWVGHGRDYEDRVERIALRRLLPPHGHTLIDIGAGFGRLADLYAGYERVVLVDYSRSLLRQAQERLGTMGGRAIFVAANVYSLPFADAVADAVVMVRVIHHLPDVPLALGQVARTLRPGGHLILEFANKRNLKAILRYLLRSQEWNPFDSAPIEFVSLNYNFHPRWIAQHLERTGLHIQARLSVSHFRLNLLKRLVPLGLLTALEGAIQVTGRWWQLSPSGFIRAAQTRGAPQITAAFFRCPQCGDTGLRPAAGCLACAQCGRRWGISDGLYDFKQPL
jgi:SAM-dependent methyltransferase